MATTAITSACTCSVDGISGHVNTTSRYTGETFTGCGAHYSSRRNEEGAGQDSTWCYVTSPDDCPCEDPHVPEGFNYDNVPQSWKDAGAAWKECYDGYRCEAWWGGLDGQLQGDPVVLNAPLDWPDCCALCSNSIDDDADGVSTAACAGWSFRPATGSCQLMSNASLENNASAHWEVNGTISGYPGCFEGPTATSCMSLEMMFGGRYTVLLTFVFFSAIVGLCSVCCGRTFTPSEKSSLLRELLRDPTSRLRKATCVEVSKTTIVEPDPSGYGVNIYNIFKGTFMTRDGAEFVVHRRKWGVEASWSGRTIEHDMLMVLFMTRLKPLGDFAAAPRFPTLVQTPQDIRSRFSLLLRIARAENRVLTSTARDRQQDGSTSTIRHPQEEGHSPSFDCLLLAAGGSSDNRCQSARAKVLLVGILGEDRLTCVDDEARRFPLYEGQAGEGICWLKFATPLFVIVCVLLLTDEHAEATAVWTSPGRNCRAWGSIGLVLCVSFWLPLLAWKKYITTTTMRLVERCPPATDG